MTITVYVESRNLGIFSRKIGDRHHNFNSPPALHYKRTDKKGERFTKHRPYKAALLRQMLNRYHFAIFMIGKILPMIQSVQEVCSRMSNISGSLAKVTAEAVRVLLKIHLKSPV